MREGLMISATPARPTLTELWDGKAALQINGPREMPVTLEIALRGSDRRRLASIRRQISMPFSRGQWLSLAAAEVRVGELGRCYDDAEGCLITAHHPILGTATLDCEREFTPLRWVITHEHNVRGARLIDNTGSDNTTIEAFTVSAPTLARRLEVTAAMYEAPPYGALLRAKSGETMASVIVPPDPNELMRGSSQPEVPVGERAPREVMRLVNANHLWASAALPAEPFARRQQREVLRTITSAMVSLVAGERWRGLEQRVASEYGPSLDELEALVGDKPDHKAIASSVRQSLPEWKGLGAEARGRAFGTILMRFGGRAGVADNVPGLGEFLLRLASDPGTLLAWDESERSEFLTLVLVSPMLLRAARFAVLAIDVQTTDPSFTTFGGWTWA
jgi:hypothetical protein